MTNFGVSRKICYIVTATVDAYLLFRLRSDTIRKPFLAFKKAHNLLNIGKNITWELWLNFGCELRSNLEVTSKPIMNQIIIWYSFSL